MSRVNCDTLHAAVLREIKKAVENRTVMHSMIAKSGGWQEADDVLGINRGQLAKKLRFAQLMIDNLVTLLAGTAPNTLSVASKKLE